MACAAKPKAANYAAKDDTVGGIMPFTAALLFQLYFRFTASTYISGKMKNEINPQTSTWIFQILAEISPLMDRFKLYLVVTGNKHLIINSKDLEDQKKC